jgi:hypothetical protein
MRRAQQLIAAAALAALLASPARARAGDKDPDGLVAVAEGLNDLLSNKPKEAQKKLEVGLKGCEGAACEAGTRAQLWVALGIVSGAGLKDSKKAFAAFEAALREDPKVTPDKQFMTPGLNKLFSEAQKNARRPAGTAGATRPPPTKEQLAAAAAAAAQLNGKDWSSCMGTLIAVMGENEFAAGKLVLAQCEDAGGLLLEAIADAKLAQKDADEEGNPDVKRKAEALVAKLVADTPSIVVVMPKTVDDPQLFVDGVAIPKDAADKPIPHNPGKATVEVKGKKGTFPFEFKEVESFDRGERVTVNVEQAGAGTNNSAIQQCLQSARTASDLSHCIESGGKGRGLTFRGGLEVASYNDTVNVDVLAPTVFFSAENPTAGWNLGATYSVDIVSNASPDIVATASRRFDEVRNAGTLAAGFTAGPAHVGLDGAVSVEADYIGRSVGASVSTDLRNKQVTPTLSYHLGFDILGRSGTPFSVFSRNILTHSLDLGSSFVSSPTTIFVVAGTFQFVDGDTSKPYRHVPMFTSAVAARLPRGATPDLVSSVRLQNDPLEHVPDSRARFALLGRLAHRFDSGTVRVDERVYADNWGLKATSTDFRYLHDITKTLRVGPHLRFHAQSEVNFWKRAYVGTQTSQGFTAPKFFTLDREMSPLVAPTVGANLRWQLSDVFAVNLVAEGTYTQFLDAIYVYDRWGFFSATTLELGIE